MSHFIGPTRTFVFLFMHIEVKVQSEHQSAVLRAGRVNASCSRTSYQHEVLRLILLKLFIYSGMVHWKEASICRNALIPFATLHAFTPGSSPVQPQSDLSATEQLCWNSWGSGPLAWSTNWLETKRRPIGFWLGCRAPDIACSLFLDRKSVV